MKKKLKLVGFVTCLIAGCYLGFTPNNDLPSLLLENMEALARYEGDSSKVEERCESCTNIYEISGVRFYCVCGSGGCYDSNCIAGSCG